MPTTEALRLPACRGDRRALPNGGELITVAGELDLATAPEVDRVLQAALVEASFVVVELGEVVFMDSAGVHVLLDAERRARWLGCDFSIVPGSASIQRLFDLTDTAERLPLVRAAPISARG